MTLLAPFRHALARLRPAPRPTKTTRPRSLALEFLEGREVPASGGGFTAGGLLGEYFDNPNLSGSPAFARRDVRVEFDWKDGAPGGSNSPAYRRVGADNFSVRWTGQIIPKYSETYTFRTTSDDGVRLWIKPAGGSTAWVPLIDHWGGHAAAEASQSYAMKAGQAYDIRLEYQEYSGQAVAALTWQSPSTPEEVIEPATSIGVNAVTYDFHTYADAGKMGRAEWGDPNDYFGRPRIGTDGDGWPTGDGGYIFWEGQDPAKTGGTYEIRFKGRAEVNAWFGRGRFRVNGQDYGNNLPLGVGYDPATNTTVARLTVSGADLLGMTFRQTQRGPGAPNNSGITGLQLMRPTTRGGSTPYDAGELFDRDLKAAYSPFTTLRYLTANFNAEREWQDRKRPDNQKAAWSDRHGVWEYLVMLANETGKDLYVTIPIAASDDYVRKLAKLLRFGSDGTNPYDGPVGNPRFPGLNPNLRVYVEWGNEVWNWAFEHTKLGTEAAREAVRNNTPDGRIINYDGNAPDGDFRRWAALKTVRASDTFRQVWGDPAMGDRVRMLLEYQYDNQQDTALGAFRFLDNYFNNGDGQNHVSDPNPVNYYIWGAGGATYYGASNPRGLVSDIRVPDGSFEGAPASAGRGLPRPGGTPWQFTGDAGVYRDPDGADQSPRVSIDGLGAVPASPDGRNALYISGDGTATVSIDLPRAGIYALDFRAAGEAGGMANGLDFYVNGQKVTPRGFSLEPNGEPWTPGAPGRHPEEFNVYGTVPVSLSAGRHTIRVVGRGEAVRTTVLDDFRVASVDAIFGSKLPGGGQAAGQVSNREYAEQLAVQSAYAQAFGLNVVAYEGGWSIGGDTAALPIMSYAKYRDPRAADVQARALDTFHRAGGDLNILGTYDLWAMDDAANAADYPLYRATVGRTNMLPAEASTGVAIPGTVPVRLRAMDSADGRNESGRVRSGEWVSWNVLAPSTGDYRIMAQTTGGGRVQIIVDGQEIDDGASGTAVGEIVRLTKGLHSIRVQNVGGEFTIVSATVTRVGGPSPTPTPTPTTPTTPTTPIPTPSPTPATPAPTANGLPGGWWSTGIGGAGGSTRTSNGQWTVNGAGVGIWGAADQFQFASTAADGDTVVTARLGGFDADHGWAKSGIMLRNGHGQSAAFAGIFMTPDNGLMFEWRAAHRSAPRSVSVAVTGPVWVRMVRRGNSFAAFYSTDGNRWTRIGEAVSIVMPNAIRAGLAVTSREANRLATGTFSNVSVT